MRYECKYCGKNFTPMIIAQMEGKMTREEILNLPCKTNECKREKQENNY